MLLDCTGFVERKPCTIQRWNRKRGNKSGKRGVKVDESFENEVWSELVIAIIKKADDVQAGIEVHTNCTFICMFIYI